MWNTDHSTSAGYAMFLPALVSSLFKGTSVTVLIAGVGKVSISSVVIHVARCCLDTDILAWNILVKIKMKSIPATLLDYVAVRVWALCD